jgi:hypothetical protein
MERFESVRSVSKEFDAHLSNDIPAYDVLRKEIERDDNIAYAASVVEVIESGVLLNDVVAVLVDDVESRGMRTDSLVPFLNHYLQSKQIDIQFDDSLNVWSENHILVSIEGAEAKLQKVRLQRVEMDRHEASTLAEEVGSRIRNSMPVAMLQQILALDVVSLRMDPVLIAGELNAYFVKEGMNIRFDAALLPVVY